MGHFKEIVSFDSRWCGDRSSRLFSVPSAVDPHAARAVRIRVSRYFVGPFGIGNVESTGHDTQVTEPAGATLIVPVAGRIVSAPFDGVAHAAVPGEALFFSPNRRQTRVAPEGGENFLGIPVIVPRSELGETAERLGVRRRPRRALTDFAMSLSSASPQARDLIGQVRSLRADLAAGDPRLLQTAAHRSWSRLLSEKMVDVLHAGGVFDLPGSADSRAANRHVRRALDFMEAHFCEIVTIADVADACGIGVRSLEAAFRELWSQTPHQALTEFRLSAARRFLLQPGQEVSVTDAAFRSGFGHLGRFASQYRGRFGESPSETLRLGRG